MYMRNYYSKAATKTLLGQSVSEGGSSTTSITGMSDWTRITEGDTTIERQPLYTTSSTGGSGGLDITKISQRYKDLVDATTEKPFGNLETSSEWLIQTSHVLLILKKFLVSKLLFFFFIVAKPNSLYLDFLTLPPRFLDNI